MVEMRRRYDHGVYVVVRQQLMVIGEHRNIAAHRLGECATVCFHCVANGYELHILGTLDKSLRV
jgi:hypothetical protein